jgi:LacI family transcriptional regulator
MLEYNQVDGVIAALSRETQVNKDFQHFKEYISTGKPFVLFDRVTDELECDKVLVDDHNAAKDLFTYLEGKGKKNIAVISTLPHLSVIKARAEGIEDIAKTSDVNYQIFMTENNSEQEIEDFLKSKQFDAVIGLDATAASISINTAKHLNINVPEELAIVGFTDGLLAQYAYPKMSVISQHASELGENTVKLLLERMRDKDRKPVRFIQKTTLIKRASSE